MQTFLIVLGVLALLFICFCLWVRAKVKRGVSWVKVAMLEAAQKELRQKAETPEGAADAELPALRERVDTAYAAAKAAHEKGDFNGVATAADAVLKELLERVSAQAKKEAEAESKARQGDGTIVIDVPAGPTSCAAEPKALPKPDDAAGTTDKPAGQ